MISGNHTSGVDVVHPFVAEGSAVVVPVDYRPAPEHPDPAPIEDCCTGLVWTAKNAAELGIGPERLLVVGSSAGGGLAAGTALMARDRAFPTLSHQVLICPMLDDRFGWTALLGERRGGPDVSPYAAPARAEDLSGLPRTYIDAGSVESFRDEVLVYARRLSEAGVKRRPAHVGRRLPRVRQGGPPRRDLTSLQRDPRRGALEI
ncbi:alpha/beta hydrolase fold domain-containing protein [Streptomyces sp. NPDC006655]|uniref:alpha/beta hydrolase fold domain-containing protein n=1 Tax=Streptomyces sp. NPDC006655 TaxID=3156898 RepID=UPI0034568F46